jgi:hypothetical protein
VLIDHRSRNILTGFNKTLQVWKYEKSQESLNKPKWSNQKQEIVGIFQGKRGQERLPYYLRLDEDTLMQEQRAKQQPGVGKGKNPTFKTTYINGVKNYQWVQDNLHPNLHKYFFLEDQPSPLLTYLSTPQNLVRPQDSIRQYMNSSQKYSFYLPALDDVHETSMVHLSDTGSEFMPDQKHEQFQLTPLKR